MLHELGCSSTFLVPCGTPFAGAIAGPDILLCVYICRQGRVPSGEDPTCQQFSHRQGQSNASVCYWRSKYSKVQAEQCQSNNRCQTLVILHVL